MSRPAPQPTEEQWQQAWLQMHQPGWPSLHDLRRAAAHLGIVQLRALALARGEHLPPVAMPLPASMPAQLPAQLPDTPGTWPFPARRRRTDAFDVRAAAAGEFIHHPDESTTP